MKRQTAGLCLWGLVNVSGKAHSAARGCFGCLLSWLSAVLLLQVATLQPCDATQRNATQVGYCTYCYSWAVGSTAYSIQHTAGTVDCRYLLQMSWEGGKKETTEQKTGRWGSQYRSNTCCDPTTPTPVNYWIFALPGLPGSCLACQSCPFSFNHLPVLAWLARLVAHPSSS